MRLLILGATGMLGHQVVRHAVRSGHDVIATTRRSVPGLARWLGLAADRLLPGVDVTRPLDPILSRVEPEAVLNCTGVIKPAAGDADAVSATAVNARAPHRLRDACAAHDIRLVHVSTDCVFRGDRGGYAERDPPDADDVYGRTKAEGEVSTDGAVTVRTSMIGRELSGTRGLVEWFLAQRGRAVTGYAGARFSGLSTSVLAGVLLDLATTRRHLVGLYHVAGPATDKYDLLTLLDAAFDSGIDIRRADTPVIDRTLDGRRFAAETGFVAPAWPDMVRQLADDSSPYERWRQRDA